MDKYYFKNVLDLTATELAQIYNAQKQAAIKKKTYLSTQTRNTSSRKLGKKWSTVVTQIPGTQIPGTQIPGTFLKKREHQITQIPGTFSKILSNNEKFISEQATFY